MGNPLSVIIVFRDSYKAYLQDSIIKESVYMGFENSDNTCI